VPRPATMAVNGSTGVSGWLGASERAERTRDAVSGPKLADAGREEVPMSAGPAEALPGAPGSPTPPAGTEPVAGGGGPGQAGPGSPARELRRRRLVRSATGLLMVAFVLATAKLYVFPKRDAPVPADAV